ncbi:MAG: beta-CASP ribonuclease aCPSF1 [archaeon]
MTYLDELKEEIRQEIPEEAMVSKIEAEGSDLVLYSKNISKLINDEKIIRDLAKKFKKRVIPRTDKSMLQPPEKAEETIREIIPRDPGIQSIEFSPSFSRVTIRAQKLGLIIGKSGKTIREITTKTGWKPKLQRSPKEEPGTLTAIRNILAEEEKQRKKILEGFGEKIFQAPPEKVEWVRTTSLGANREVGRSCFLLETPESKVLLDAGIKVDGKDKDKYPYLSSINFSLDELDAVVVSHAHLDHSGFIPYLYNYGYNGPVYSTSPTRTLMTLLQKDFVKITEREGKNIPYTQKEIKKQILHSVAKDYGEVTDITPDMRLTLQNAGHILGSSITHLHIGEGAHNLVYTGDLKFGYTEMLNPAHTKFPRIETLIIESTYGGQGDRQKDTRESKKRLLEIIKETTDKNGTVLIPAFGVGRSQAIMLILEEHHRKNNFDIPVYIDGMIKEASAIHTAYPEYLKRSVKKRILHNKSPFESEIFQRVDRNEREDITERGRSVIVSPSGMMSGGPVIDYFKKLCGDEKNQIIFVGYQAQGTLGRKIERGNKEVVIENGKGELKEYKVRAGVETISGFSGHADINELLGYYKKLSPKPGKVLVVHGEENKTKNFAKSLNYKFKVNTTSPKNLESIRLK